MDLLRDVFGEILVSQEILPPRSPDLLPVDFHLWGVLKTEVKETIINVIQNISQLILLCDFPNKTRGVDTCQQVRGDHFQHLPVTEQGKRNCTL
jgi:hypothetical protein